MRVLGLALALCSGTASAAQWQIASSLPNTHLASAVERAALVKALHNSLVAYNFENDSPILVHDGDLRIEGNLENDTLLVVRGNLTVDGMYDDYRREIGVLVVLGDMQVGDAYSLGAMYVQGDLRATGLLMTVYDDFGSEVGGKFSFEVGGKLDARALLIRDKSADFTPGNVGASWTDNRNETSIGVALRTFQADLFTRPRTLELDEDSDLTALDIDHDYARERLSAGEPVFRDVPGDASLPRWAQAAIAPETTNADLAALIGKDALIDQLIAARTALPRTLAEQLVSSGDQVVLASLARTAPWAFLVAAASMTPAAAASLAGDPDTGADDVERIATHANPQVRIALAERPELSIALINRLAADPDAAVRAAIIEAHFNVLELEPDVLKARLADTAQPVRNALAGARLDTAQAKALLPSLSEGGVRDFSRLLLEQARGARPTALDEAGILAVADAVLARNNYTDATTNAFMSLPPTLQLERLDALVEAKALDLAQILESSPHADLLRRIVALADAAGEPLTDELAGNPYLPKALQLDLISHAASSMRDPDSKVDTLRLHYLLAFLLNNDAVGDEALLAATDLALALGLRPAGVMQAALLHHHNLPPEAIAKLDRELHGDEDWALKLLRKRRATPEQVDRALRFSYDHRPEIRNELRRIEAMQVDDYFSALATAKNSELREVAATNVATPVSALLALLEDSDTTIAWDAATHPSLPIAARLQAVQRAPAGASYKYFELPAAQWDALATTLPTREQRIAAMAQAARMRERAMAQTAPALP